MDRQHRRHVRFSDPQEGQLRPAGTDLRDLINFTLISTIKVDKVVPNKSPRRRQIKLAAKVMTV